MNFKTILLAYRKSLAAQRLRQADAFEARLLEMWRRRRQSVMFCAADVDRAVNAVIGGVSVLEACAQENVEEKKVLYEIMRRGGLKKLRPRLISAAPRMEGPKTAAALRMVADGRTVAEASAASGATRHAIRSALARRGGLYAFREQQKGGRS